MTGTTLGMRLKFMKAAFSNCPSSFGCRRLHRTTTARRSHVQEINADTAAAIELRQSQAILQETNLKDFDDQLFDVLSDQNQRLSVLKFKNAISVMGLRTTDPRLRDTMQNFAGVRSEIHNLETSDVYLDREMFKQCVKPNMYLLAKAFRNHLIIPEFTHFTKQIQNLYWRARTNTQGKVASYIPQLARYSPDYWSVSVCTVDGQRYSMGDSDIPFCLQSASKPLTYSTVLNELGPDIVHQYVGHEPSGRTFNEISLDNQNKPHNPMINAGAMVLCSLIKQDYNISDRFDYTTRLFRRMCGGETLAFNNAVFLSERETADRNFAIAYYVKENKGFPAGTNLMETLDFYFQLCSVEVTTESASVVAATLANGGICPITDDKIVNAQSVRDTLSLMHSCGMYDYSGRFAFEVGLPAKSGVSGVILLVVPNVMGIALWSPPLDKWGNSNRGIQFCQDLVSQFNFHNYDNLKHTPQKLDPTLRNAESHDQDIVSVLFSAFNGDINAMRRHVLYGMDMSVADYDGRTPLHLAAAEGHMEIVLFLLDKCNVSSHAVDRWKFKPIDDAKRFGHNDVVTILEDHMTRNPSVSC